MKGLVTGADGFVGSLLVRRLLEEGHEVGAAMLPQPTSDLERRRREAISQARTIHLDLTDQASVRAAVSDGWDVVFHLAAVSSGSDAHRDPIGAWLVNSLGTARLAHELAGARVAGGDPLLLLASTAEVYGVGSSEPRKESDPTLPCSPYAASKLAAEVAALEVSRRTGLRVVVSRAFPHTGPGQDARFVVPAFAERILLAQRLNAPAVTVGNLDPVRDFLHVGDVVAAYTLLADKGRPGEVYNIASGQPVSIGDVFFMLTDVIGYRAIPEVDHALIRKSDIPYLVGDANKLRQDTGWEPHYSLTDAIQELVNAQAD